MLCKFPKNGPIISGFQIKIRIRRIIANLKYFPWSSYLLKIRSRYEALIVYWNNIVLMSMRYFVFPTRHSMRTFESSAYYCGANGSLGRETFKWKWRYLVHRFNTGVVARCFHRAMNAIIIQTCISDWLPERRTPLQNWVKDMNNSCVNRRKGAAGQEERGDYKKGPV